MSLAAAVSGQRIPFERKTFALQTTDSGFASAEASLLTLAVLWLCLVGRQ
jgi:hypothetical protein